MTLPIESIGSHETLLLAYRILHEALKQIIKYNMTSKKACEVAKAALKRAEAQIG